MRFWILTTTLALGTTAATPSAGPNALTPSRLSVGADTVHVEVGSPLVNGSVYQPHVGRVVQLRITGERTDTTADWLNTLVIGDSAGRVVHRWHTGGWSGQPGAKRNEFNLWSTFDGRTLALLGWHLKGGGGFEARLAVDGKTVRGTLKPPASDTVQHVQFELPEAGFASGAADLIPYAVGLREGLTMTLPLWSPPGRKFERETWTVTARDTVQFDGRAVPSWVMEQFAPGGTTAKGRIWFVDEPPYVVQWDVLHEDGTLVRMIGMKGG